MEGCGWGQAGLGGRGRAAVKPSPRVRRILIPRTERQTDGQTPHPLQPCFPGSPRAFCLSHVGELQEAWSQAPGSGEGGPSTHKCYVQGHGDTDTYKYTQACTHAHKYTRTHTYHSTGSLCVLASPGEHLPGPWRGWPTLPITAGSQSTPAPGWQGGAGRSRSSMQGRMTLRLQQSLLPSPPLALYPPSPPSCNVRAKPTLSSWQPSVPRSYLWPARCRQKRLCHLRLTPQQERLCVSLALLCRPQAWVPMCRWGRGEPPVQN